MPPQRAPGTAARAEPTAGRRHPRRYAACIDRILILCTANQCRSPMAEGLLRHLLEARGISVEVRSAGVLPGGVVASAPGVDVLAARGIDISAHRSRRMAVDEIAEADLVLGMERRHVQEAVVLHGPSEAWSFTLRDLVRRAEATDPRRPDESLRAWAGRLAAGRTRSELLGIGDDNIADPMGKSPADYERTAAELDDLLGRLVDRAYVHAGVTP